MSRRGTISISQIPETITDSSHPQPPISVPIPSRIDKLLCHHSCKLACHFFEQRQDVGNAQMRMMAVRADHIHARRPAAVTSKGRWYRRFYIGCSSISATEPLSLSMVCRTASVVLSGEDRHVKVSG